MNRIAHAFGLPSFRLPERRPMEPQVTAATRRRAAQDEADAPLREWAARKGLVIPSRPAPLWVYLLLIGALTPTGVGALLVGLIAYLQRSGYDRQMNEIRLAYWRQQDQT